MLRTKTGLVGTMLALSLAGWVGCGDDDGGGDDGSGTDTGSGSGTDTGSGDGSDGGSDDGGSGSDDGGTGTGSNSGTGTGSSGTGTGSSGTGTGSSGTGTGSSGTGTGTGSSGTGTGSVVCEDINDRDECMGTWGCNWEGGGGSGQCVPFDGDCSSFGQQHCEAMVECVWDDGNEECTGA